MSLRGCFGCLKFFVFVVNFLFWLLGLGVLAVSLWLLFDQQLYLQNLGAQQTDYYVGTYIILGVGAIMTLVGFLGCCGAWKESTWMLGTFFLFLVIIFLGEIGLGLLVYFKEAPYQQVIRSSVEATVARKYHGPGQNKNGRSAASSATTQTFDLVQEGLHCCGADGPLDWSMSVFNKAMAKYETPEIGISNKRDQRNFGGLKAKTFNIPESCCVHPGTGQCQVATRGVAANKISKEEIYQQGCTDALIGFCEAHLIYLVAIGGAVAFVQLVGMLFSVCLCCALKRIEDFKA